MLAPRLASGLDARTVGTQVKTTVCGLRSRPASPTSSMCVSNGPTMHRSTDCNRSFVTTGSAPTITMAIRRMSGSPQVSAQYSKHSVTRPPTVLGFADLSRHLRTSRQLIISTHERRFAGLLERKLAPRSTNDATLVLEFLGWDRSGPSVESRRVEPQLLERPIRVVGAA